MTWEGLSPPYATIVADPPWPYQSRDGQFALPTRRSSGVAPKPPEAQRYSPLSMADLTSLNVVTLAAGNAHLYLWTTNAFMVEAHDLARAWGFQPKTILTWVKTHQNDPGRASMKMGYWFRSATEHVVFAVRGTLPLQTGEALPTAYLWPRIGGHSVKPPAFYDLVERASPGPWIDLFARQPRLGWDSWGWGYEQVGA